MKVCILTIGRSASTNLFNTLSYLHKFDNKYCEPFSDKNNISTKDIDFSGSVLLKQIVNIFSLPKDISNLEDLFDWIYKNFTHIICLYRENTQLQTESLAYHQYYSDKSVDWFYTPKYVDTSFLTHELLDYFKKLTDNNTDLLKNFAIKYKYPLISYENLIDNEGDNDTFRYICNYINVKFDYNIIYNSFKKENKVSLKNYKLTKLI